jgi:protein tyrosine kinase modulator
MLDYLNGLYRHRLIIVCALTVGLILTVVTVKTLPNVYKSTTLIMVEPQDVPETYVKATVTTRLEKRLQAMNQEVMSRTRLEGIIKDFGLFAAERQRGTPVEVLVDRIRKRVNVEVFPADNAFRISFEGGDPKVVQQVTARLASHYIDENLRIREEHASGTTEFMESELDKARRQLEEQEGKIQEFKQKYMGELPEQQGANMQTLEGLRAQLRTLSVAVSAAQERKMMLDKQVSEARAMRPSQPNPDGQLQAPAGSPTARLRQLESQLADLRSRYTQQHPDVIQAQNQIARLKEQLKSGASDADDNDPFISPDLLRSVQQARMEIERLQAEEERAKKGIDVYQDRVEKSFVREQELEGLTRDHSVTQRKYQALLDKKLEAQLSQSLEHRQKAERFRILDPASLPQSPVKPNRPLLAIGGAALSLAFALGIPILLWQLDTSYHSAEDLSAAALPVLAVIPQVHTTDVDRRKRLYRLRVLAATAVLLIVGLGASTFAANFLF